jgi:hypothetical protein
MRRRFLLVLGALAFAGVAFASGARAQLDEPTTTPTTAKPTTTTSPPITFAPTTTAPPRATTTTAKPAATTTTVKGGPKPPPASGASQPLDPSLLGGLGPIDLNATTTTTLGGLFGTEDELTTTTIPVTTDNAINVASSTDGPSGAMLGLAAVAWLASLGGLLIYAEDQRGKQWRHLAR